MLEFDKFFGGTNIHKLDIFLETHITYQKKLWNDDIKTLNTVMPGGDYKAVIYKKKSFL